MEHSQEATGILGCHAVTWNVVIVFVIGELIPKGTSTPIMPKSLTEGGRQRAKALN
jgi:hypothetical protein